MRSEDDEDGRHIERRRVGGDEVIGCRLGQKDSGNKFIMKVKKFLFYPHLKFIKESNNITRVVY